MDKRINISWCVYVVLIYTAVVSSQEDCRNVYIDDGACQYWAERGDCSSNPGWMVPNCRKACGACAQYGCNNTYGNDVQCDDWAFNEECAANPIWMTRNCRKSCGQCDIPERNETTTTTASGLILTTASPTTASDGVGEGEGSTPEPEKCINSGDEVECLDKAARGECALYPDLMIPSCRKACGSCVEYGCTNQGNRETCKEWVERGDCQVSRRAQETCRMSCGLCPTYEEYLATVESGSGDLDREGSRLVSEAVTVVIKVTDDYTDWAPTEGSGYVDEVTFFTTPTAGDDVTGKFEEVTTGTARTQTQLYTTLPSEYTTPATNISSDDTVSSGTPVTTGTTSDTKYSTESTTASDATSPITQMTSEPTVSEGTTSVTSKITTEVVDEITSNGDEIISSGDVEANLTTFSTNATFTTAPTATKSSETTSSEEGVSPTTVVKTETSTKPVESTVGVETIENYTIATTQPATPTTQSGIATTQSGTPTAQSNPTATQAATPTTQPASPTYATTEDEGSGEITGIFSTLPDEQVYTTSGAQTTKVTLPTVLPEVDTTISTSTEAITEEVTEYIETTDEDVDLSGEEFFTVPTTRGDRFTSIPPTTGLETSVVYTDGTTTLPKTTVNVSSTEISMTTTVPSTISSTAEETTSSTLSITTLDTDETTTVPKATVNVTSTKISMTTTVPSTISSTAEETTSSTLSITTLDTDETTTVPKATVNVTSTEISMTTTVPSTISSTAEETTSSTLSITTLDTDETTTVPKSTVNVTSTEISTTTTVPSTISSTAEETISSTLSITTDSTSTTVPSTISTTAEETTSSILTSTDSTESKSTTETMLPTPTTPHITPPMYVSNETHILLIREDTRTIIVSQPGGNIVGLALDEAQRMLFWTNNALQYKGIYSSNVDGTEIQRIAEKDVLEVNGLAIDTASRLLFWTDAQRRHIQVSKYDGSMRKTIIRDSLQDPRGIVLDIKNKYLYWNDQGTRKIERSRYDGSKRETLLEGEEVYWPNQMSLTEDNRQLVWGDAWLHQIKVLTIQDRFLRSVDVAAETQQRPVYGLVVKENMAYFSVWSLGSIFRADLATSAVREMTTDLSNDVLFSMVLQQENSVADDHPCGWQFGLTCPGLCLPTGGSNYECACPDYGGVLLSDDGRTCESPDNMLLFAMMDRGEVAFMPANHQHTENNIGLVGRSNRPVGVAYDPITQMVYWSDVQERQIYRAPLDGSDKQVFMNISQGLGFVEGLTMDWQNRNLYFTNVDFVVIDGTAFSWHKIEAISVETMARRVIVSDVGQPRGIYIEDGQLFYTDWGDEPKVVRCNLDGTNPVELMNKHNGLQVPNGAVPINSSVYVIDSNFKSRELGQEDVRATLFQFENNDVLRVDVQPDLDTPFAITKSQNMLVISDWGMNSLVAYDVETGQYRTLLDHVMEPTGVVYTTRMEVLSTEEPGVCSKDTCEGICLSSYSKESLSTCQCSSYELRWTTSSAPCTVSENFIIVSDMNTIKYKSLDPNDSDPDRYSILYEGDKYFSSFSALTYDEEERVIYFTDVNRGTLERISLTDNTHDILLWTNDVIDDLSYEPINGYLYWTESMRGCIRRAPTYNVSLAMDLICELDKPQALEIANVVGYMFWVEQASAPSVWRSRLDGSDKQRIWFQNGSIPSAVQFDSIEFRIYILDSTLRAIYWCSLDGDSCEAVHTVHGEGTLFHAELFGNYILYSDWGSSAVSVYDTTTNKIQNILSNLMRPTRFVIHHPSRIEDYCENSRCSDICQPGFASYTCECEAGRMPADEFSCVPVSTTPSVETAAPTTEAVQTTTTEAIKVTTEAVLNQTTTPDLETASGDEDLFTTTPDIMITTKLPDTTTTTTTTAVGLTTGESGLPTTTFVVTDIAPTVEVEETSSGDIFVTQGVTFSTTDMESSGVTGDFVTDRTIFSTEDETLSGDETIDPGFFTTKFTTLSSSVEITSGVIDVTNPMDLSTMEDKSTHVTTTVEILPTTSTDTVSSEAPTSTAISTPILVVTDKTSPSIVLTTTTTTTTTPTTTTTTPTTTTTTPTTTTATPTTTTSTATTTTTTPTTTTTTPTTTTTTPTTTTTTPTTTTTTPTATTTTPTTTTTTTPTTTITTPTTTTTTPTTTTTTPTTTTITPTTTTTTTPTTTTTATKTTTTPTTTTTTTTSTTPTTITTTPTTTTTTIPTTTTTTTPTTTTTTQTTTTTPTTTTTTLTTTTTTPTTTTTTTTTPTTTEEIIIGPQFAYCPEDISVYIEPGQISKQVWWREPAIISNPYGDEIVLSSTHTSGSFFPIESTEVTYTATNERENLSNDCTFIVQVKEQEFYCDGTPDILNGELSCRHDNFIYKCRAQCNHGYVNLDEYKHEHMCGSHGWIPGYPDAYAKLACMRDVSHSKSLQMTITFAGNCNQIFNSEVQEAFKDQILQDIRQSSVCNSDNLLQVCSEDSYSVDCAQTRQRKKRAMPPEDILIVLDFWVLNSGNTNRHLEPLQNMAVNGELDAEINGVTIASTGVKGVKIEDTNTCPRGSVAYRDSCLLCPYGTYLDENENSCEPCAPGFYQMYDGQLQCDECVNSTTSPRGAFLPDQCYTKITVGTTEEPEDDDYVVPLTIALAVVGGLIFLGVVAFAIYTCYRLHKQEKKFEKMNEMWEYYPRKRQGKLHFEHDKDSAYNAHIRRYREPEYLIRPGSPRTEYNGRTPNMRTFKGTDVNQHKQSPRTKPPILIKMKPEESIKSPNQSYHGTKPRQNNQPAKTYEMKEIPTADGHYKKRQPYVIKSNWDVPEGVNPDKIVVHTTGWMGLDENQKVQN